ncbi:alpha-glucosidase, partial [Streptomyces sp. SID10115]|uniref:DUF3459 domain-containing protein n=1 Tax=Streptomyces sp. SID10115 TaxID=2706016 RepID=UPI0013CA0896|nr:alpha-glucosidase [Streptomyces sp. SID10115]
PDGVPAFAREGFVCTVNTTAETVRIPAPGRVLLGSEEAEVSDGTVHLPADTTVWWAV